MAATSEAPRRAPQSSGDDPEAGSVEEVTRRNVDRILALEASEEVKQRPPIGSPRPSPASPGR